MGLVSRLAADICLMSVLACNVYLVSGLTADICCLVFLDADVCPLGCWDADVYHLSGLAGAILRLGYWASWVAASRLDLLLCFRCISYKGFNEAAQSVVGQKLM